MWPPATLAWARTQGELLCRDDLELLRYVPKVMASGEEEPGHYEVIRTVKGGIYPNSAPLNPFNPYQIARHSGLKGDWQCLFLFGTDMTWTDEENNTFQADAVQRPGNTDPEAIIVFESHNRLDNDRWFEARGGSSSTEQRGIVEDVA